MYTRLHEVVVKIQPASPGKSNVEHETSKLIRMTGAEELVRHTLVLDTGIDDVL